MNKDKTKYGYLAVGFALGVAATLLFAPNRYEIKPDAKSMFAWRIDKRTGKTELLGPNGQPVMQQQNQ